VNNIFIFLTSQNEMYINVIDNIEDFFKIVD